MNITQSKKFFQLNFHILKKYFHNTNLNYLRRKRENHYLPNVEHSYTEKDLLFNTLSDAAYQNSKNDYFESNPYDDVKYKISDNLTHPRPTINPSLTHVVLFPDFQYVKYGMGRKHYWYIPEVRKMFDVAVEILQFDIKKLMFHGPGKELRKQQHQQPASLLLSLALIECAKRKQPGLLETCRQIGYFGLGDLAALTFTGVISFESALRLSQIRGELMQEACDMSEGGLLMIGIGCTTKLKLALEMAIEVCKNKGISNPICTTAVYLQMYVTIIGGHILALQVIEKCAADFNIHNVTWLNKAQGAFYTDMMKPAVEDYKKAVNATVMNDSPIPVCNSYNFTNTKLKTQLKKHLVDQITAPVKWEQVLHKIYKRDKGNIFPSTYICGNGYMYSGALEVVNRSAFLLSKVLSPFQV